MARNVKKTNGKGKKAKDKKYEFHGEIMKTGFIIDPGPLLKNMYNTDNYDNLEP